MAAFLVAGALASFALPTEWIPWTVLAAWMVSVAKSRVSSSRGMRLCVLMLGFLVVAVHVDRFGPHPAVQRALSRAEEKLSRLRSSLAAGVVETNSRESTTHGAALDSMVSALPGSGLLVFDAGGPVAWSGFLPDEWGSLAEGTWVVASRTHALMVHVERTHGAGLVASVPIRLQSRHEAVTRYDRGISLSDVFTVGPPFPLVSWTYIPIAVFLMLETMAYRTRGRLRHAVLVVIAGRLSLAAARPHGVLFDPEVFASSVPLLESPADALATGIALLLLAGLVPATARTRRGGGLWAAGVIAGVLAGAGMLQWVGDAAAGLCTVPVDPLERLVTMPTVWALCSTAVCLFGAWVLWVAHAGTLIVGLTALVAGTLIGPSVFGAWPVALLMLGAVMVVRVRQLWTAAQNTGIVLLASLAILPAGERLLSRVHRVEVERLAARVASDQTQWFHFLAREALRPDLVSSGDILDLWRRGPLTAIPVAGQIAELDNEGWVAHRLSFGLRYDPIIPEGPAPGITTWEDVTDEPPPPRPVVNGLRHEGGRAVVVTLVADLLTTLSARGTPYLADGSSWPGALRLADQGLLSLQGEGDPELGWRRDPTTGEQVFRFQREFGDGPHLVDFSIVATTPTARFAAFLALAGMLCLVADAALAAARLWVVPSWRALFYRYRDRLLPLLLVVGVGPVVCLIAIGPSLERAARDRDWRADTYAKARDVGEGLRSQSLRRAASMADYAPSVRLGSSSLSGDPRVVLLDREGNPLDPSAGEVISPAVARVVAGTGRSLLWIAGDPPQVYAVVPQGDGAMLMRTPLDAALSDALGGAGEWSVAVWRAGRITSTVLSPGASPIPGLLPGIAMRALGSSLELPVYHEGWVFANLADDMLGQSLVLGVRLDRPGRLASQWEIVELWALAVFLPLISLTILGSSLAARIVSTPVSRLTALAAHVGDQDAAPRWPAESGELGELSRALDGMTTRLAVSAADIARQKTHLETILQHIAAGVIVVDRDLLVQRTNAAVDPLMPWVSTSRVEGRQSLEGGPLEGLIRRALDAGAPVRDTLSPGDRWERRSWQVGAAPLGTGDIGWIGAVVVLEEITQLVERERLRAWAEFAREAAHELKNPLTPIKLSAQHLRRAFSDGFPGFADVLDRATEMIERQATRMEGILRDFSSFARATGREFTPVDVCEILAQCAQDYGYYVTRGISIRLVCATPHVLVRGDVEALRTVFGNILDNAAKAIESGGTIDLQVACDAEKVLIRCDDSGPGIPSELREKVFDAGFSLRPGGSGLGLSICRSLVAAHGGSIRIAERESGGARIEVSLPLLDQEAPPDAR